MKEKKITESQIFIEQMKEERKIIEAHDKKKELRKDIFWIPIGIEMESAFNIIEASMEAMLNRKWGEPSKHIHPQDELNVLRHMWERVFTDLEDEFYKAWKARNPNYG